MFKYAKYNECYFNNDLYQGQSNFIKFQINYYNTCMHLHRNPFFSYNQGYRRYRYS